MTQTVASTPEIGLLRARGLAGAQLQAVRQSYRSRYAGGRLLPLLAAGLLLLAAVHHWAIPPLWVALAILGLVVLAAWAIEPLRRFDCQEVARRLDRLYPELEDSTGLLLPSPAKLPLLGQLQVERVAGQLTQLTAASPALLPFSFKKPLLSSALLVAGAAVVALLPAARQPAPASPAAVAVHFAPDAGQPVAAAAPRITKVELLVTPTAYTRRAAFVPAAATFQCPQGAQVRWRVHVNRTAGAAPTLEIGSQKLTLRPAGLANQFEATQILNAATLYRLRYAGQTSDDYAIDVRPDQLPTIRVQTPKAYTLIAARGTRPEVPVQATLRDDYGLARAELVITVAQGQGEAVKFHEVRRDLSAALGGQPGEATVRSLLDLPKLGLTYGDELYFYVQARDNHGQSARSDAFLVQWQDTAAAASAMDMGMGVNTAPAYFRSERQIIIDTEKLIADKPRLTAAEFSNRANALGFDQQSLRLRYGKFLGEEAEKGLGVTAGPPTADEPASPTADAPTADEKPAAHPAGADDDHDDHDHHPEAPAGRQASPTAATDALMDPYMHKHDDSETADFLEPAVKAKLHAVLDEMWAAELRLRTGQPAAARPFEYRALRLLKQVQQQTRAYVKKAGFTPTPFPEATLRLTGELKGAAAPRRQATVPAPTTQPAVRAALRWLATQSGQPARPADAAALTQAGAALAQAALQKPGLYLPGLRALRQLAADAQASRVPCATCLPAAQRALADLLPAPVPTAPPPPAPDRLAQRYFQELSR